MREKLNKILNYLDMLDFSKRKEQIYKDNLNKYYEIYSNPEEKKRAIERQEKVTKRIENRIQTLKTEL